MADAQEPEDQEFRLPEKPQAEYTRSMAIERTVKEIRGLTVEEIVGKKLADDQKVYIMIGSLGLGTQPDEAMRKRAAEKVQRIMKKAAKNAEAQGITEEEIDAAVDEAQEHVRRNRKL